MNPSQTCWKQSSRSMNQGACVEVAWVPGSVAARDSKDPDGPILRFDRRRWASFLAQVATEPTAISE